MADFVKFLVTVDPEAGEIVRAQRLGAGGELSEVPADAFTLEASVLAEPVERGDGSESEAASPDDPKPMGPKGPAPVGPKAVGPKSPAPVGPKAVGPKSVGPKSPEPVGQKAVGPKGVSPQDPEKDSKKYDRESPEGDDGEG